MRTPKRRWGNLQSGGACAPLSRGISSGTLFFSLLEIRFRLARAGSPLCYPDPAGSSRISRAFGKSLNTSTSSMIRFADLLFFIPSISLHCLSPLNDKEITFSGSWRSILETNNSPSNLADFPFMGFHLFCLDGDNLYRGRRKCCLFQSPLVFTFSVAQDCARSSCSFSFPVLDISQTAKWLLVTI